MKNCIERHHFSRWFKVNHLEKWFKAPPLNVYAYMIQQTKTNVVSE